MATLHAIQGILNDPQIKCRQAKDVRWLSHDNAIKALVGSLPSLLVSLDRKASENSEPTAHGLLKFMKSYKFVATMYLLSDVLPHLSRLSKNFLKEDVDLSLIQPCSQATIETITRYKDSPGPNLSKVDVLLSTDLKDLSIEASSTQKESFKMQIPKKYIEAVVTHLEKCFPSAQLLEAFSIFNPQTIAALADDEIASSGCNFF